MVKASFTSRSLKVFNPNDEFLIAGIRFAGSGMNPLRRV
jgi:hypothetical protein